MHIANFHKIRLNAKGGSHHCEIPGCSASFATQAELKRHENIHNNTPRFKCMYCQYTGSLITQFSDHMATHYGELEYSCKECSLVFGRQETLNKHMDIHNQIKYKCTICSTIFGTRKSHEKHVIAKHDIHENTPEYRLTLPPEVTEKDMKEMFPNRKKTNN